MATQVTALLHDLADSVGQLRAALQNPLLSDMEQVLARAQAALDAVNAWPGGSEALQAAMDELPPEAKALAQERLSQARQDHAVNAELLALAMQRNAALQAEAAITAEEATYSSDRAYQMGSSGRLLGKF